MITTAGGITHPRPLPLIGKGDMTHVFVCLRHSCLKLIGSAGGITHPRPLPLLGKGDMTHVFVFCCVLF